MSGPKHCVKTPQRNFKNLIDSSLASVLSTQAHLQLLISVLKVYLQAHFYMVVLLMKLSQSEVLFAKLFFGLEVRLCNRAFINLFVNQNQHCLLAVCT